MCCVTLESYCTSLCLKVFLCNMRTALNITCVLWRFEELIHIKHLEKFPARNELSEPVSNYCYYCLQTVGSMLCLVSHVWLFATPWPAACQASLSITNSWSLLKLMSIESVMPSNHLILSSPSPPTFNLCQNQGLFQWVSPSHQVATVLEFQLQHQSFQWIFRTNFL